MIDPISRPFPPHPSRNTDTTSAAPLFLASLVGLAYFGLLGLFLDAIILAVVLEAFPIYQEEYRQYEQTLVMGLSRQIPVAICTPRLDGSASRCNCGAIVPESPRTGEIPSDRAD